MTQCPLHMFLMVTVKISSTLQDFSAILSMQMNDELTLYKNGDMLSLYAPHSVVDVTTIDPCVTTLQSDVTSNLLYFFGEGWCPLRNAFDDVTTRTGQIHCGCGSAVRSTGQGHGITDIYFQISGLHRIQGQ